MPNTNLQKNDWVPRVIKNFAPSIASALSTLGIAHPELIPLITYGSSVIGYFGDYANEKTLDLLKEFEKNKEKIIQDIIESEKFKSIFIKILSDNITESNEEKRQYLKNYLLNVACGIELNFNEHTKLINTLNTITIEQIEMLKLWDQGGPVVKWVHEQPGQRSNASLTLSDLEQISHNYNHQTPLKTDAYSRNKNNQTLRSLGYKELLAVLTPDNFGSGQEAKTKWLTEFGHSFLHFIRR